MADEKKGIEEWMGRLEQMEAVALGSTIHELNELTVSDETSVNQLAGVILRDASLTSKVLRAANSVYFNPGGPVIGTVSRGIVQLGFSTIRSICLTAILLETLLKEHPRDRLLEVLAHAFHCAIQARNLCAKLTPEAREEVFIAALLYNLGEMMVWASPHPIVDRLQQVYRETRDSKAVESELGFSFQRLTRGLAEHWRLGDVLKEASNPGSKASRKAVAVILGDRISTAVRLGMRSEEMQKVLKKVATFTGDPEKVAREKILDCVEEAAELTHSFGGKALSQLISGEDKTAIEALEAGFEETWQKPDPMKQLQILQELTTMMQQKIDTNVLFQMIIEGLHRGVGLERVALAIFDPRRTQLTAKYILGEQTHDWRERFHFAYQKSPTNFFGRLFEIGDSCWIGSANARDLEKLRTPQMEAVIGRGEFLVAPIIVDRREIGILYSDLRVSSRPLTAEYFSGFRHFAQQASFCMGMLAHRSHS